MTYNLFLPWAIFLSIVIVTLCACMYAGLIDWLTALAVLYFSIYVFAFVTAPGAYSVSGTVTEVSDVRGKPFVEVELDSIDHSVRMMGNAGVKELVGKEKTFTCTYKGQTTEDDPIYVCK